MISATSVHTFILTLIYAFLGIVLLFVGYRVFDWLTPGDLQSEIFKQNNKAVAILVGGFIIGLGIVILGVIHG